MRNEEEREVLRRKNEKPVIFISYCHDHQVVCDYFKQFLDTLGFFPLVVEEMPSKGAGPPKKVKRYMEVADVFLILFTPDEKRKGEYYPASNVVHESATAEKLKPGKVIYLKERKAQMPSDINPTYCSFDKDHLPGGIIDLIRELAAMELSPIPSLPEEKKMVLSRIEERDAEAKVLERHITRREKSNKG